MGRLQYVFNNLAVGVLAGDHGEMAIVEGRERIANHIRKLELILSSQINPLCII